MGFYNFFTCSATLIKSIDLWDVVHPCICVEFCIVSGYQTNGNFGRIECPWPGKPRKDSTHCLQYFACESVYERDSDQDSNGKILDSPRPGEYVQVANGNEQGPMPSMFIALRFRVCNCSDLIEIPDSSQAGVVICCWLSLGPHCIG